MLNTDLHLVFVDFVKAVDSVDREGLWMALRRRVIPFKIVSVIKSTYNGAQCRVLHSGTLTAAFVVGSGVRQGCILSPALFLVVIGDIIQASIAKQVLWHKMENGQLFAKLRLRRGYLHAVA